MCLAHLLVLGSSYKILVKVWIQTDLNYGFKTNSENQNKKEKEQRKKNKTGATYIAQTHIWPIQPTRGFPPDTSETYL